MSPGQGVIEISLPTLLAALAAALCVLLAFRIVMRRDRRTARASERVARGDLLDRIPQLVWSMSADGTAEFFNAAWARFTGRPADKLLAHGIEDVIHPDDRATFAATWRDTLRGKRPREIEVRLREATGERFRWYLARAYPMEIDGEIVRWIGTATDIHERRLAFERTREVADRLQEALAPGSLPSTQNVLLDATFVPAHEAANVGGDWYDALQIDDRTMFFALGDVAGHGLDAAVTMSRVRQLMIGAAIAQRDPAEVLRVANRALALQETTIVTAVAGFIDIYSFQLSYAVAGHPAPILVMPEGPACLLESSGTPLNLEADLKTRTYHRQLHPGSMLVLYTDGLTEVSHDIISGERRLLLAARAASDASVINPSEAIRKEVFGDAQAHDDVAVLTIKFGGAPTLHSLHSDEDVLVATASRLTRVPKTRRRDGTQGRYGHHLGGDENVGKPVIRRRA